MIGETVSHYRVIKKIGEGGMGEVYLAEDTSLDRKVAVKFLPLALQQDETAHKRFIREAKSAAALDHPFICNIHEVSETDDGRDFIVMEYVEGRTLQEQLAQGRLPLKDALQVGIEVAEALEVAHQQGIVHRDLKPSNIILTPQGHPKVMDFGLAKKVVAEDGTEQDITSALTQEGSTLGTPAYMSPEQIKGDPVDNRCDLFSFGIVLYEMLTGVHPFRKPKLAETTAAILQAEAAPLSRYVDEVPELLGHVVSKMLAKSPDQRYQMVHEVRSDLRSVLGEQITGPVPVSLAQLKKRQWLAVVAALAVLIFAFVWAGLYLFRFPPEQMTPPRIQKVTSSSGMEATPHFSPDGKRIVFMHTTSTRNRPNTDWDIYLQEVGRPNARQLTRGPDQDVFPAWSPSGDEVAFARRRLSDGRTAIFVTSSHMLC
jgi:serine/threonine protein kinase